MAVFNPQVAPTPDFNPIGYSHPISDVKADTSTGVALTGAGNLLEGSVKFADTLVKKNIDEGLYRDIDTQREDYLAKLKVAESAVEGGERLVPASKQAGSPSLLQPDPKRLPAPLQLLPQKLDVLENARANGKITETPYFARLDAIAKEFRAKYPGYREYIDKQVSEITGVNPANAEIKSRLADINSYMAGKDTFMQNTIALLHKNFGEVPNAPELEAGLRGGRYSPEYVLSQVHTVAARDAQFNLNEKILKDYKGTQELRAIQTSQIINTDGSARAADRINSLTIPTGPDRTEPLMDVLARAARPGNTEGLGDEQWQAAVTRVAIDKQQLTAELRNKYRGLVKEAGGTAALEKLIADQTRGHDDLLEALNKKESGVAHANARGIVAMGSDAMKVIMESPDAGPGLRVAHALKEASGPVADVFIKSLNLAGLSQTTSDQLKAMTARILAPDALRGPELQGPGLFTGPGRMLGPNQYYTPPPAAPYTFNKALDQAQTLNAPPALYKKLLDIPQEVLTNPKVPDKTKVDLIKSTFSDGNLGMLSKLPNDSIDPTTKRPIPGKYAIYSKFTSPEISAEVKRLADTYDPNIWSMYKNWAEQSAANDLFRREVADLREINLNPAVPISWSKQDHRFELGPEPTQLGVQGRMDTSGAARIRAANSVNTVDYQRAAQTVNRLNGMAHSLTNIYRQESADETKVDAKIYAMFHNFDPNKNDPSNIMYKRLMQSIIDANKKKEESKK